MTVVLGELAISSPVMTAAGCAGIELSEVTDLAALGAHVTRTITLDPRPGPSGRRLVETASGLLTELGWDNPGLQSFLASELPVLAQRQVRTIVSIAGRSLGEYAELARRAGSAPGVAGIEVSFADHEPHAAAKALSVVRRDAPRGIGVLAKIPLGEGLVALARELAACGPDALVVGHPHRGAWVDPSSLTAFHGGLSGPGALPLALDALWRVYEAVPEVPLVGVGGIRSGDDALAFLAAGATAVQVGTALLRDPSAAGRVQDQLTTELDQRGLKPADVVGIAHAREHTREPGGSS